MEISVILPVYNGAAFIIESVVRLQDYLRNRFQSFEIILVNDGSTDNTADRFTQIQSPNVRSIELARNMGKFAAIKAGVNLAEGSCILFTDADIPYEMEAIAYMEKLINQNKFHLVIGDRGLRGSEYREHLPFVRKCCTLIFSHSIRLLVTGELFDTQCGLKAFRADIAKAIFAVVKEKRFSGDVELLYIALKYNLILRRIPVRLQRQGPSTVRSVADGLQMLCAIAKLRSSWVKGRYKSEELFKHGNQFYWET